MNNHFRLSYVLIFSFLLFVCFVILAFYVHSPVISAWDTAVLTALQSIESPQLTWLLKQATQLGSLQVIVPLVCVLLFLARKHRTRVMFFLTLVAGCSLLNYGLKLYFRRDRPSLYPLIQETGFSFPSGHSMQSLAWGAALAVFLWPRLSSRASKALLLLLTFGMAGAIGFSRIYLGVHYPSDVVGGFLAAGCWITLCIGSLQWYGKWGSSQDAR